MEKIRNVRDLEIWKLGKSIVADVYRVTKELSKEAIYGLMSQMRRAAVSIPSSIAAGFARDLIGSTMRNTDNFSMSRLGLVLNEKLTLKSRMSSHALRWLSKRSFWSDSTMTPQ